MARSTNQPLTGSTAAQQLYALQTNNRWPMMMIRVAGLDDKVVPKWKENKIGVAGAGPMLSRAPPYKLARFR